MTVSYVKAYFNSTNSTRISEYSAACDGSNNADDLKQMICQIPDQTFPPNPHDNKTGHTYFFTQQENMTVNQTVYDNPARGWSILRDGTWLDLCLWLSVSYFIQTIF